MSIWFEGLSPDIETLNKLQQNTVSEQLGIQFTEVGADYIRASMPVDNRTRQPYGLLHGGSSVVLAETLGSVAAALTQDITKTRVVGQAITANHLRSARNGSVIGTVRADHIGRRSQVWSIDVHDGREKLICVCRLTVAVLKEN
ncbi:MAG: hotdog fold thioesterase [Pseudomonadota bacterium]